MSPVKSQTGTRLHGCSINFLLFRFAIFLYNVIVKYCRENKVLHVSAKLSTHSLTIPLNPWIVNRVELAVDRVFVTKVPQGFLFCFGAALKSNSSLPLGYILVSYRFCTAIACQNNWCIFFCQSLDLQTHMTCNSGTRVKKKFWSTMSWWFLCFLFTFDKHSKSIMWHHSSRILRTNRIICEMDKVIKTGFIGSTIESHL